MVDGKGDRRFAEFGIPVVLMVGHKTERVVARAEEAGVTSVVEKPLLGGVLFDAIRTALTKNALGWSCASALLRESSAFPGRLAGATP